jgi:hypothetical protein
MAFIAALLVLVFAAPAAPATCGQDTAPAIGPFLAALQRATAANDRRAVAAMARYPLEVTAGGLQIPVPDAATFVALYDTLMTPAMKAIIAAARVPAAGQRQNAAAATPDGGLTLGEAMTIRPVGQGFRIVRLEVPLRAPASSSPGERVARQLTFRVGTPTLVNGTLQTGGVDRYDFHAQRGAFVEARLTGVPGRTVLLRLTNRDTGAPLDARADAGTRVWTGRVSESASYRIEVVRQPDTGAEPLIYTLSVGVR